MGHISALRFAGLQPAIEENEWMIVATFERREEEAYAVAHRLKWVKASRGLAP